MNLLCIVDLRTPCILDAVKLNEHDLANALRQKHESFEDGLEQVTMMVYQQTHAPNHLTCVQPVASAHTSYILNTCHKQFVYTMSTHNFYFIATKKHVCNYQEMATGSSSRAHQDVQDYLADLSSTTRSSSGLGRLDKRS